MNCTFFGHRDVSDAIKGDLEESILSLIETERIELFLVGNNGNFDFLVQEVLAGLKREGKDIRFRIVLSRLDEKALSMNQKETVFPEELENTIPKFAISKRNEWLIKNSSFLIAFVKHRPSSSAVWVERAARRGLAVRNIAKDRNAERAFCPYPRGGQVEGEICDFAAHRLWGGTGQADRPEAGPYYE